MPDIEFAQLHHMTSILYSEDIKKIFWNSNSLIYRDLVYWSFFNLDLFLLEH